MTAPCIIIFESGCYANKSKRSLNHGLTHLKYYFPILCKFLAHGLYFYNVDRLEAETIFLVITLTPSNKFSLPSSAINNFVL